MEEKFQNSSTFDVLKSWGTFWKYIFNLGPRLGFSKCREGNRTIFWKVVEKTCRNMSIFGILKR